MSTHIAIRSNGVPTVAEMLYFDKITLVSRPMGPEQAAVLRDYYAAKRIPVPNRILVQDDYLEQSACLDYLTDKGVIVDISDFLVSQDILAEYDLEQKRLETLPDEILRIIYKDQQVPPPDAEGADARKAEANEIANRLEGIEIANRLESILMAPYRRAIEAHPNCHATSVISRFPSPWPNTSGDPVLEIVINRLPTPTADTPLEAVIEFRSDPDAMRALRRLRQWMSRIARQGSSAKDIEAELDDLIDRYTEYMNVHKMKCHLGTLHSLVSVSLDVLENLTRLRFKAAFDAFFSLRSQRLALTEAEINAPGREAAYIVRTEETFAK